MMSNRKRRYSVTNIQQDFHKYILNDRGGNVAMAAVENKRVGWCSFFFCPTNQKAANTAISTRS